MVSFASELTTEIEEVESHLESSAPLLHEQKGSPSSPKTSPLRIDMLEEKPQPEKYQDDSLIGKVVDCYRDARAWQYVVGPAVVVYTLSSFITAGSLRFD